MSGIMCKIAGWILVGWPFAAMAVLMFVVGGFAPVVIVFGLVGLVLATTAAGIYLLERGRT